MRSRTELVTTTFVDSEDDFTETDDSEEDWRPSASTRNVKKRTHSTKGRNRGNRKRKSSSNSSQKNPKRQAAQDANYQTFDDSDDEDDDDYEYYKARTQLAAEVEPKAIILPPKKKERNLNGNTTGVFQLYLYRKDLKEDYMINSHLCLWRKDGTNLLQKYIRVKTGVPEEFIFTSSSVYSTWDEKRRRDFINVSVKCLEENNRRVTFVNTNDLHSLAKTELERVSSCLEQVHHAEEENDGEADADGSEHNSIGSECDENDDSYRPDEDDADGDDDNDIENENEHENENDNIDEVEEEIEEEHASDDDQDEEEFEEFGQLEEDDEDDDNSELDDNVNENEAEYN